MNEKDSNHQDDNSSIDSYLDQLNKLIENKKKENKSIQTIVDAMVKNQQPEVDQQDEDKPTNTKSNK